MKFTSIDAEKAAWPVEVLCKVLDVSLSGFFALEDPSSIETYATCSQARVSIEDFYNPVRRHSSIGYLRPIEVELVLKMKQISS